MNRNRARQWRHGQEIFLRWLPAIAMSLLAIGVWWLVQQTPGLHLPESGPAPLAHVPDYEMHHFSVQNYSPDGHLRSELSGILAEHFPDTDTLEVQDPRMLSLDETGLPLTGGARRGVSNHDGSIIELFGQAKIHRAAPMLDDGPGTVPAMEFRGEYLKALPDEERVSSDQPVQLFRGLDHFEGQELDYDNRSGIAHLRGQVKGLIHQAPH